MSEKRPIIFPINTLGPRNGLFLLFLSRMNRKEGAVGAVSRGLTRVGFEIIDDVSKSKSDDNLGTPPVHLYK